MKHKSFKKFSLALTLLATLIATQNCDNKSTPPDEKSITAFVFSADLNQALSADVRASLNQDSLNIIASVPAGTNVSALVANFETTGASVQVAGVKQINGTSPNDFSAPLTYKVTSLTGAVKNYTVSVVIEATVWSGPRQFGTPEKDEPEGITVDSKGNIYITGWTEGSLDGNPNQGGWDMFLVKYNRYGQKLWTRQFGEQGMDNAAAVTVDSADNIYVAGAMLIGRGGNDVVIIKLDNKGQEIWNKRFGTPYNDEPYGITVDQDDNILVAGKTSGNIDGNNDRPSTLGSDTFTAKYNPAGERLWIRQLGADNGTDFAFAVVTDSNRNVYITGDTVGNLDGGSGESRPMLLVKYDLSGNLQWIRQTRINSHIDRGRALAVDSQDNVYIAGAGPDYSGDTVDQDAFLLKYSPQGEKLWVRELTSTPYDARKPDDVALGVVVDGNDHIHVTGNTAGNLVPDFMQDRSDYFVAEFNTAGEILGLQQFTTDDIDEATGMAIDTQGNLFITGWTWGRIGEDPKNGNQDGFLKSLRVSSVN